MRRMRAQHGLSIAEALVSLAIVGYYQGALRVTFSLVGLLLAALLAVPLSGLVKPLLPAFGLTHPLALAFVAPAIIYLLVLILFKSGALVVHKKLDTWMKYHASDTQRALYERMNSRVGVCVGLANATVYLILISMVAYTLGYFTTQVASEGRDNLWLRMLNGLNANLRQTGLLRAAAHYSPATEFYYDAADLIGGIFHNPLLQSRLSSYPPFLTLADRSEFKALGEIEFQQFWQRSKSISEVWNHERLKPLIQDVELYTNLVSMLDGDLKDLINYFQTGVSPKYEDDKILGRWKFNFSRTYAATKRSKPTAGVNEINRLRKFLPTLANTTFLATVDHKAVLKVALGNESRTVNGTWKNNGGGRFGLRMMDGGKTVEVEARADADWLSLTWLGYSFVLERVEK